MAGGHACHTHPPPHPSRYYEIRSMNGQYASYWNAFLLPPANVVCEGYIFTGICHSVNRGACVVAPGGACVVAPGGACVVAPGGHAWFLPGLCGFCRGACVVFPRGACVVFPGGACVVFPRGGVHGFSWGACVGYEIRSMSGRYASYWNAFLLVLIKTH